MSLPLFFNALSLNITLLLFMIIHYSVISNFLGNFLITVELVFLINILGKFIMFWIIFIIDTFLHNMIY